MLGFNASGVSFFYCLEIALCKIKAKENDNAKNSYKNAVIFSSRIGGFELIGDDELMAGGKMYDILANRAVDGVTEYYAASDNREDEILNKLSSTKNKAADKSLASLKLKIYAIVYCLHKGRKYPNPTFSQINPIRAAVPPGFYWAYFQAIVSPPPEYFPS